MFACISLTKGREGAKPKPSEGSDNLVIDFSGIWDQLKG